MSNTTSLESLTLEGARAVMAAAQAEARSNGWAATVAIADATGAILLLERDERAWPASVDVAIGKAASTIRFGRPTRALEEMINGGRTAFVGVAGVTPLIGGVPLVVGGRTVGAIGVSGLTPDRDEVVAKAGAAALA
jgi:glc operon protein GlcG